MTMRGWYYMIAMRRTCIGMITMRRRCMVIISGMGCSTMMRIGSMMIYIMRRIIMSGAVCRRIVVSVISSTLSTRL